MTDLTPAGVAEDAKVTIPCGQCGGKNRIPVIKALRDLSRPNCGRCKTPLLRVAGEPLSDLEDADLAHPLDADALAALRALPRVDELIAAVMKRTVDKIARFRHLGGAIAVDSEQLPKLWAIHEAAARRLGMPPPPLFVVQSPALNAYTAGSGDPFVAITSGLVDRLDDVGVASVLGHELTHVRLGHALYRTLAHTLIAGGVGVLDKLFAVGALLVKPVEAALLRWYQYSELSADRGALLVVSDLEAHLRTEMVVAGAPARFADDLSVQAFLAQADRAEAMRDGDLLMKVTDFLDANARTHPLAVWRAHHVATWAHSDPFFEILAGAPRKRLETENS